jgi:16S rRNA (guanine527-N7)-methyltransferase
MRGQYVQISSRAFAELGLFVSLTRHLLAPGGCWLAMKGVRPDEEIKGLPAGVVVDKIIPLDVPGLDAERHLIILKVAA